MAERPQVGVRELELEYRYLDAVRLESKMAHIDWLEKLAGELMESLREFLAALERGEK